jgi:hypothetical protein
MPIEEIHTRVGQKRVSPIQFVITKPPLPQNTILHNLFESISTELQVSLSGRIKSATSRIKAAL